MFGAILFTVAKIWIQSKYPTKDEWIKKMWNTHTHKYYLAIKRTKFHTVQQHRWTGRVLHLMK